MSVSSTGVRASTRRRNPPPHLVEDFDFGDDHLTEDDDCHVRALLRDDDSDSESDCEGDEDDCAEDEVYDEVDRKHNNDLPEKPNKRRCNPKKKTPKRGTVRFYFLDDELEILDQVLENHSFDFVPAPQRQELAISFSAKRRVAVENGTATFQEKHATVTDKHIRTKFMNLRQKVRRHAAPLPPLAVSVDAVARCLRERLTADTSTWSESTVTQLNNAALAHMCDFVQSPLFRTRFIAPLLESACATAQVSFDERSKLSAAAMQSRDVTTLRHQVAFTESFEYGSNSNVVDEVTFADIVRCTAMAMRALPDIVQVPADADEFCALAEKSACVVADTLAPFSFNWSPKATKKLRVFVDINPKWPVPLLCLVVGRSCLNGTTTTVRSPALVVCQSLVQATLHAASIAARRATSPPSAVVTLSRAFESLMDEGVPRLASLSTICKVWFDDIDLLALHHLANSALRKLFEVRLERMKQHSRVLDCWLPVIMSRGADPTNALSKAMTPNGVFLRESFFFDVMLPVARAVYTLPFDSPEQYSTLCSFVRSAVWFTAIHNVVFVVFAEPIRLRADADCPDVHVPDADDLARALAVLNVNQQRECLRDDMEEEIEKFISGWLVMKFVRILLSVRLKRLNTQHRDLSKVQNYRRSGVQSNE